MFTLFLDYSHYYGLGFLEVGMQAGAYQLK